MINTELPYLLTEDDAQFDPVTIDRLHELSLSAMVEEIAEYQDGEVADRILRSASVLYLAHSRDTRHPLLGGTTLYTACLDTAMIWEFG